jgi:8-oxo-dGTP pyrophosphatase MutT (NUDIX family)
MTWLSAGDPALEPSGDPGRSACRLDEAEQAWAGDQTLLSTSRRVGMTLRSVGAPLALRTTAPGHLTASAVVVHADRSRILVLMHTKLRRWLQPGGHADGDHELAGVALREATEETGITGLSVFVPALSVDVHVVDHGDALGAHLHLDVQFMVAAPPAATARGNHESTELRWVTVEELGYLVEDPGLVRLASSALELARRAPAPPGGWIS